jgi:hypothetical protein
MFPLLKVFLSQQPVIVNRIYGLKKTDKKVRRQVKHWQEILLQSHQTS